MPTGGDSVPPPFPLVVTAWNPPLNALLGCAEVQAGIEAKALGVPAWGSHIQGDAVSLSEGPRTAVRGLASAALLGTSYQHQLGDRSQHP